MVCALDGPVKCPCQIGRRPDGRSGEVPLRPGAIRALWGLTKAAGNEKRFWELIDVIDCRVDETSVARLRAALEQLTARDITAFEDHLALEFLYLRCGCTPPRRRGLRSPVLSGRTRRRCPTKPALTLTAGGFTSLVAMESRCLRGRHDRIVP
jgi:hypothetical protein